MPTRLPFAYRKIANQSQLFSSLPPELREELLDASHALSFRRGEHIFVQGDTAHFIHIVAAGWVKLYRIAPNGAEAVVGVMTRGRSFGEPIALRRESYPVSAAASTDCRVIAVPARDFLRLLQDHPEAMISILAATFAHLKSLVEQIEQLKARSGAQRVAEFLLDLCPEGAESANVTLPYDKVLIAGRLGLKPESLSRAFARLRDHGVAINQSDAAIASVSRLRDLAEAEQASALRPAI